MVILSKLASRTLPSTLHNPYIRGHIAAISLLKEPFFFQKPDIQHDLISNLSLTSILYKSVESTDSTAALNIRKFKKAKPFSTEENQMILKYVKKYGATPETWKMLAKECDRQHPGNIRLRYEQYLKNEGAKLKLGRFSPEEDQIILDNVERHGLNLDTFKKVAVLLGRNLPDSIKTRHEFLTSNKEKNRKRWTSSDDKKLLEAILKLDRINPRDISGLCSVNISDFTSVAKELQRSKKSCWFHYYQALLPILKTHILGLPQGTDWMRELLRYIVDNQIKSVADIDYFVLCNEQLPGQTRYSMANYISNLTNPEKMLKNTPLCDIISDKLSNPSPNSILGCEKVEIRTLQYAKDIIEMYKSIS